MGSPGAGKSTFARKLGALIGAPVIHMDTLYWTPGWIGCEPEEFRRRTIAAHEGEAWVSDGDYTTATGEIRIPRADKIIWVELPRWLCVVRVIARWAANAGGTRVDLAPGCPEAIDLKFIAFVWNYRKDTQPRQRVAIEKFGGQGKLVVLRGDRAKDAYLRGIELEHAA
jgi:adenylate kinase family enzyme